MLTKFRNFTDWVANRFVDMLSFDRVYDRATTCQVETLECEVLYLKNRIKALSERNSELEQINENLIIQRFEVRKRLDEIIRHFPKEA